MTSRVSRWLRDSLVLLCFVAGLLAFVIQSGELGTSDTTHRLQTTHWLWTPEPQVFPNEYPEFGIHGRRGQLYSWYGIGQSLLMLPADLIGTWISSRPIFRDYGDDPAMRSIVVSYSTNILVNVLTALVAFRFLRQLRFTLKESVVGVLALMFATTHLHYTQNMMENNYIMLLTLVGFSFQYEWLETGSRRALFWGSCALGLNLLTRLTTGLDLIAAGLLLGLTVWFDGNRARSELEVRSSPPESRSQLGRELWQRLLDYIRVAAPVYAFFLLMDRAYQFYRFGSWTTTYVSLAAQELRHIDPSVPANFPWTTPFHEGFLGALFKPEKSIFLFDPLLIGAIILLIVLWRRLTPEVRAYGLTSLLLLLAYLSFYARYAYWAGDFAWGDRYVSTSVELTAFLFVPLLLRYREQLGKAIWRAGLALVAISVAIQLASLVFWLPLEIYQMETLGHPTFVIALRFKNMAGFALGKMGAWGLNTPSLTQDPWDYVHITTWNFLPFLLRRVGAVPGWIVDITLAIWLGAIAALVASLLRLRSCLRIAD
jgi:hypothetical protein